MDTLQPLGYGIATTFFILGTISIGLRVYSRIWLVKSFGLDDWSMSLMFFFNIGQQAMWYLFLKHSGGIHINHANPNDLLFELPPLLFAEEIYYIWMHFHVKMCFLFFYLRLSQEPNFKCLVYITMGLNTCATVGIWLLYCLQCTPIDAFIHPTLHPNAKCIATSITYFIPASLHITMDFIILLLPLPTLLKLKVSPRRKIELISIFSVGSSSVLISVLRLIVLFQFYSNPDFTYILGKMIIISSLEIEVAIIAANMPSIKSIWIKHVTERGGMGCQGHRLEEYSKGKGSVAQTVVGDRGRNKGVLSDSEEELFSPKKISSVGVGWTDLGKMNDKGVQQQKTYYQIDT